MSSTEQHTSGGPPHPSGTGAASPLKAQDFAATSDWPGYFKSVYGKPARDTLIKAAELFETDPGRDAGLSERLAVDLAAGEGRDTLELLRRGWRVLAIEMLPEGVAMLRERVPADQRSRLETQVATFAAAHWPECDLLNCSFALPFCPPAEFDGLWARIVKSLRPGGRFAGQLFGNRDSWAASGHTLGHSPSQVDELFRDFEFEMNKEEEKDDVLASGAPKHWHVFHIVASKK